jgi:hypothetical protein
MEFISKIFFGGLDAIYYALPLILCIAFAPRILRFVLRLFDKNEEDKK